MSAKKHYFQKTVEPQNSNETKIVTLLQFARKAGKVAYGFEACKREILNGKSMLLIMTKDLSENTRNKIQKLSETASGRVVCKQFGTQEQLSAALGLPFTGLVSILDNNFASKIVTYFDV